MEDESRTQTAEIARALEALSRDLLALFRGVRVYPPGHRFVRDLAGRLVALVARDLPAPLSLGVTSKDLAVGAHLVGGRNTRASELAAFLHGRKVLRVAWDPQTAAADVVGFAEVLADPKPQGEDLPAALRRKKVYGIEVEPLALERIHDLFRETPRSPADGGETRGREAWLWLLGDEVSPGRVAEILSTDGFWEVGTGAAPIDAPELTGLLARLGERLGEALDCLPRDQRRRVEDRLARAGRQVSPQALADILRAANSAGVLQGPLGDALEETFGGDKLVDLLAGLVAQEGRSTHRLAEVYGRFGRGKTDDLLPAVRARLASSDKGGFTVEVWDAVEEFLLKRREDPYMDAEYSASLEALAAEAPHAPEAGTSLDFAEDLGEHLDRLLVGLAWHDADGWAGELFDRLEARAPEIDPRALLSLLRDVDGGGQPPLDAHPSLVELAFRRCLDGLKDFDAEDRKALLAFALDHEAVLLDAVLRRLEEEKSIAARRFLVELVAGLSPSSTPALVSRTRSAPWYVARNLTTALGKRREALALPAIRWLIGHEHPKVRREAILALGQFDTPSGREALAEVAARPSSTPEERDLAERALRAPSPGEAAKP